MKQAVKLPSHRTMRTRFVREYGRATERDKQQGWDWYRSAREFALTLQSGTGYSLEQIAGVIAVLSPNVPWDLNMTVARNAVDLHSQEGHGASADHVRGAGYTINKSKALRILDGDLTALSGPKVTAFAAAIQGAEDAVTIDLWMLRVAGIDEEVTMTPQRQVAVERALRSAAELTGETPATFQAIVWSAVRNRELGQVSRHAWRVK